MSKSISNQVLHPTNPLLLKDVNTPKENGQTRVLPDGSLLYREPLTNTEVPAVRLNDIRPRLVQEASRKISYRFPKKRGYEDTNVTAFVKKDYNFGPERDNRPDRLFQIEKDGARGEKPDGYVMDQGRIVLDAFDHGLRNFGNQLPMYVSSELEGQDIEDYLRRNWEISVYDLVARAPNGYYKGTPETRKKKTKKDEKAREWHEGPPRVGTFSMRATRFRLSAGCLSWDKKDGTDAKNQRIRDVIPAEYKDPAVNSTRGWRDLNKAEIKRMKDGAMRKPQQGPKEKRAAQAEKDRLKEENSAEDSVEQDGFIEEGGKVEYGEEDSWIGAADEQGNNAWLNGDPKDFEDPDPAPFRTNSNPQICVSMPQYSDAPYSQVAMKQNLVSVKMEPERLDSIHSRKRSRGPLNAGLEEGNTRAPKRARITADVQCIGSEGGRSRPTKLKVVRQQPRVPPPSPYAVQATSSSTVYPGIGDSIDGQEPISEVSGGGFDFSLSARHENRGQPYSSSNIANAGPPIPNTYNFDRQCGSVGVSMQSRLARNDIYQVPQPRIQREQPSDGYAQPGVFQVNKMYDENSGFETHSESELHSDESPEHGFPVYEPRQISSVGHGTTQHESPLTQPVGQEYLQQTPPGPRTAGKRKRTAGGATEHLEGRRPTKRAKGHTTKPAPTLAPEFGTPLETTPGAHSSTPKIRFERPTPGNWEKDTQNTGFPQTRRHLPNSIPDLVPSINEEPWSGEGPPFETHGHTPTISSQPGMLDGLNPDVLDPGHFLQAADPIQGDQEARDSLVYDVQPHGDFDRGQWEALQAVPSMELDPSWTAWDSQSNA